MKTRTLLLAAASVVVATPLFAQRWRTLDASRQLKDSMLVDVRLSYAAGKLELRPSTASSALYNMSLKYDAERGEPRADWDASRHALELGLKSIKGSWNRGDQDGGSMHADLSTVVPLDLTLELGAVEGDLQLGGLRLTSMRLKAGAADVSARWDQPNKERMRNLVVEAGAASVKLVRAGNAHADRIDANVGVGGLEIDLGGEWTREIEILANVAMGKFALRLPTDVGIVVESNAFLVDFDKSQFRKRGNDWYSDNYDGSARKVRLKVNGALGGVSITRDTK
jgi:hypothetical protein